MPEQPPSAPQRPPAANQTDAPAHPPVAHGPEELARRWDERYAAGAPWGSEPNRWVRLHTEHLPPGRALDVACGDGRHALWLASRGWSVRGVDFSAEAIARGRAAEQAGLAAGPATDRPAIEWEVADATMLASADEADLVLLVYLHLPEPAMSEALSRAAAAVAAGGTFLLVAHDRTNLTDGVGGPQDPSVLTEPAGIVPSLEAAGLVVDVAEVARRPVPDSDRPALDTVVVAHRPLTTAAGTSPAASNPTSNPTSKESP